MELSYRLQLGISLLQTKKQDLELKAKRNFGLDIKNM